MRVGHAALHEPRREERLEPRAAPEPVDRPRVRRLAHLHGPRRRAPKDDHHGVARRGGEGLGQKVVLPAVEPVRVELRRPVVPLAAVLVRHHADPARAAVPLAPDRDGRAVQLAVVRAALVLLEGLGAVVPDEGRVVARAPLRLRLLRRARERLGVHVGAVPAVQAPPVAVAVAAVARVRAPVHAADAPHRPRAAVDERAVLAAAAHGAAVVSRCGRRTQRRRRTDNDQRSHAYLSAFSDAKSIAGTNAFIFSIIRRRLAAMHTVFLPTSKSACKTRHAKANRRIGLRSIIGVGQALPLDCFKAKGMTVTEAGCRPVSLQSTAVYRCKRHQ